MRFLRKKYVPKLTILMRRPRRTFVQNTQLIWELQPFLIGLVMWTRSDSYDLSWSTEQAIICGALNNIILSKTNSPQSTESH